MQTAGNPVHLAFAELAQHLKAAQPSDGKAEESWKKSDLRYKFWKVQHQMAAVLESPSTASKGSLKKVLNCSRRLRKTSTALILAVEMGLKKKKALIRFAAPTREDLITIIEPIMEMICEDAPAGLKPEWRATGHHYYFPSTGARLFVSGCDNLKMIGRLRGKAADLCVVDEAQEIVHLKYLVNDVLMPQLLGVDKPRGPLWILFTPPKTPVHDCFQYAAEAQAAGTYAEFDIYHGEYSPNVIEIFKKEAGGEESTTWKREYLCQAVVDTNFAIVPEWNDNAFTQAYEPDEFYRFYHLYVGMDIGVQHLTVALFAVYDFKRAKLYVLDEFAVNGPRMTTQVIVDYVKEKEKKLWGERKPNLRIADNNNLILLQDLGLMHGLTFAPTSKDTLEAMVNHVRLWVKQEKLYVSPQCAQLLGCLKYGVWNDNRTDWEVSSAYGHYDALAALMYLVRNVDVLTNPVPPTYGMNPALMHVSKELSHGLSGDAKILQQALLAKRRKR